MVESGETAKQLIVSGGGANNSQLMARLKAHLPYSEVIASDELGWPSQAMEASAFAWLAYKFTERETGNLPAVTGAKGERILGALYPR
jgi:anhydro-N-acetylmuramic acid kinase